MCCLAGFKFQNYLQILNLFVLFSKTKVFVLFQRLDKTINYVILIMSFIGYSLMSAMPVNIVLKFSLKSLFGRLCVFDMQLNPL